MNSIGKKLFDFSWVIAMLIAGTSFNNQVVAQTGQEVVWYEKLYDNTAGLLGGHVYQVFEDKSGFLWVVTESSLQFFDGNHFYPVYDHFSVSAYDKVRILCQDGAGRVWVRYEENGRLITKIMNTHSVILV